MTRRRPICHFVVYYMFKLYFSCVLTNWTIKGLFDWLIETNDGSPYEDEGDEPATGRFPDKSFSDGTFPRQVVSPTRRPVGEGESGYEERAAVAADCYEVLRLVAPRDARIVLVWCRHQRFSVSFSHTATRMSTVSICGCCCAFTSVFFCPESLYY